MSKDATHINKSINPAFYKTRKRQKTINTQELATAIVQGDITALSQGITLIESTVQSHQDKGQQLIEACLSKANKSVRIGITGVPGVGKSTFIETFGNYLTSQGHKVAVLAVDPTSSVSHGSILGDKTRMYTLAQNPNAYIRPSASGKSLGGVARKTREAIILCEAAGFDVIIIETVGVGQSETIVHSMVDFFLLLKLAGAGDELQGIKRGIIEMADAIVINKADGGNTKAAKLAKTAFAKALHLFPPKPSNWTPKVTTCSALENKGIEEVWKLISDYTATTKKSTYFKTKRAEQNKFWLLQTIENKLKDAFYANEKVVGKLDVVLSKVAQGEVSPFIAAQQLLKLANE